MTAVSYPAMLIERCFDGPPRSGHGGYTYGLLARELHGAVQVSPRSPAPLDPPPHLKLAAAQPASSRFLGFAHHPFPTCFGCGPNRAAG
jgi:hypothetical protein